MNFEFLPAIVLETIDSTNAEAMRMLKDGRPVEGTCIRALYQTAGKGQRSNQWLSNANDNLLVSFILYPPAQLATMPFALSKCIALAVQQTLATFSKKMVEIKWPNDLLIGGKKTAGILIENQWSGSSWSAAIAGIGINVNQQNFEVDRATSISSESNEELSIEMVLSELQCELSLFYNRLCQGDYTAIDQAYHQHLFGRDMLNSYATKDGEIKARVGRVLEDGKMELISEKGETFSFDLSELRLLY